MPRVLARLRGRHRRPHPRLPRLHPGISPRKPPPAFTPPAPGQSQNPSQRQSRTSRLDPSHSPRAGRAANKGAGGAGVGAAAGGGRGGEAGARGGARTRGDHHAPPPARRPALTPRGPDAPVLRYSLKPPDARPSRRRRPPSPHRRPIRTILSASARSCRAARAQRGAMRGATTKVARGLLCVEAQGVLHSVAPENRHAVRLAGARMGGTPASPAPRSSTRAGVPGRHPPTPPPRSPSLPPPPRRLSPPLRPRERIGRSPPGVGRARAQGGLKRSCKSRWDAAWGGVGWV